jgi:HD superfamily phosphohydrolase YqeK
MSGAGSTEPAPAGPSAVVREAAAGRLPAWACMSAPRREHAGRVAALLGEWAEGLGLPPAERDRWVAAGWLHDALRDERPAALRDRVPAELRALPGPILHGPAAAEALAGDVDPALADAIRYHTIGHPRLDRLGRALYLADFLEPGRDFEPAWREQLRERMPGDLDAVLVDVLAARLVYLAEARKPIRPETAAFWSALVQEP